MKNIRQGGLLGGRCCCCSCSSSRSSSLPGPPRRISMRRGPDTARSSRWAPVPGPAGPLRRRRAEEVGQEGGQRDRGDGHGPLTLGIKGKMKALKVTGRKEIRDGHEESAEVRFEKMTMNEVVNVLYAIDHAPVTVSVKRVTMKKSFENPELLDVTMTLSLFL
ncbi:MAG: hypothetical protein MZV70_13200 [Desulfobacterales bacterium]|nr:hypothetical protein [Desulfobacterales bacterium]